jgi:hypothetical protein
VENFAIFSGKGEDFVPDIASHNAVTYATSRYFNQFITPKDPVLPIVENFMGRNVDGQIFIVMEKATGQNLLDRKEDLHHTKSQREEFLRQELSQWTT